MIDKKIKASEQSGVYSGEITMTLKKGQKAYKVIRQHNSGTFAFFQYLLKAVRGDNLYNDRPAKAKLIYESAESSESEIGTYGVIYSDVTDPINKGTSDNPIASTTYKFIIPETIVPVNQPITGIQLESVHGVVYATVNFKQPVTITKNTNIALEWELKICNK